MSESYRATVAIQNCGRADYPEDPPFDPPEIYPEYPYREAQVQKENWVYTSMRETLRHLGLDRLRFGTASWNPLGAYIRPGDRVVIKPNLVISEHELGVPGVIASVAHGSVIRALVDYSFIACGTSGRITICDSPIKEVDFQKVTSLTGTAAVVAHCRSLDGPRPILELLDIRDLQAFRDANGTIVGYTPLPGDPRGYTVVDLAEKSMLAEVAEHSDRLRSTAAIYEDEASANHGLVRNLYSFPNSVLEADCIISVAKLKVHRKCGVTLALKNMVGSTNEKRWLPHHRSGTPNVGGDMCPDDAPRDRKLNEYLTDKMASHRYGYYFRRFALPAALWAWKVLRLKKVLRLGQSGANDFREGDWHGNDTIWRTVLDLNMALTYADERGSLQTLPQRTRFNVIDGIIGGDREGPLHPRPRPSGMLVMGDDPVAVDSVSTALMGFDPLRVRTLEGCGRAPYLLGTNDLDAIEVVSNDENFTRWREAGWRHLGYEASEGWAGHLELDAASLFFRGNNCSDAAASAPNADRTL